MVLSRCCVPPLKISELPWKFEFATTAPAFRPKPAGEGTGVGLSMSHDIIVKQHGGSIDVETEPGKFTEFKIVLPRASRR